MTALDIRTIRRGYLTFIDNKGVIIFSDGAPQWKNRPALEVIREMKFRKTFIRSNLLRKEK